MIAEQARTTTSKKIARGRFRLAARKLVRPKSVSSHAPKRRDGG